MQITVRRTASLLFSIKEIEFVAEWGNCCAEPRSMHVSARLICIATKVLVGAVYITHSIPCSVRGPNNTATKNRECERDAFRREQSHSKKTRERNKENRAQRFNGELKCLNMEAGCCCNGNGRGVLFACMCFLLELLDGG